MSSPNPTRFRVARRVTFAGAGSVPLFSPLSGQVLNVRQVTLSTSAAAELVAYFGANDADRLLVDRGIAGVFLAANGGAAPGLDCLGAWAPSAGLAVRLYASAACTVWVSVAGYVE